MLNLAIYKDLNRKLFDYEITIGEIYLSPIGRVQHVMIYDKQRKPSWSDVQKIKNTLYGNEAYAVQVFPPESKLVDVIDAYHIWVKVDDLSIVPVGWDKTRSVLQDKRCANTEV